MVRPEAPKIVSPSFPELRPLEARDREAAVALALEAMGPGVGPCAAGTLNFHFACQAHGLDDGRRFHAVDGPEGTLAAFAGLKWTPGGPKGTAWLSWLAVGPAWRGRGLGTRLLRAMTAEAAQAGATRLYLETYEGERFAPARRLYAREGFEAVGGIRDYHPDGGTIILCKSIYILHASTTNYWNNASPAPSREGGFVVHGTPLGGVGGAVDS